LTGFGAVTVSGEFISVFLHIFHQRTLKGHITPVRTLAFSPDGLALVSGGVGGLMNICKTFKPGFHFEEEEMVAN
uniref:Anaphase-promoting complex subunit 4 WD40 domain-containing protein n=1 Tax=Amphiprion percula TaxID=161767 RepID=A0A3P8RJ71_AMPPE